MQPDTSQAHGLTWFIYYRVDPARLASVIQAVRLLMARISASCPELRGQLMQRPTSETPGGELTLMEIYRLPPSLDEHGVAALHRTLDDLATELLGSDLARQRHLEVFVPCA